MQRKDFPSSSRRLGIAVIILVAVAVVSSFHEYPYDNVVTRWALTRQLVDNGALEIDQYHHLTSDKAFHDGHYYCDKAVLTSIAAAAPYGILKLAGGLTGVSPDGLPGRYAAERLTAGLSLILLLMVLSSGLLERGEKHFLPLLALGGGSILLPYSTLLYGHVIAALLLYLSYLFQRRKEFARADICGVLAVAVEFPVALPFAILLLYRGLSYWKPLKLLRLAAFSVLAMLPQLLHNWIAFGSPLTMGYSLETADAFQGMSGGLFGFTFPSLRALYLILISPERGLLFYMPWAVLGFAGFFRRRKFKAVLLSDPRPLMTVLYVLLFSAYYMPSGGWAFGPRHLIPVIPFLACGLSRFIRGSKRRLFSAALLTLPAIVITLIGTFGEIHQPVHPIDAPVPLPQFNIGFSMLLDGHHSTWITGPVVVLVVSAGLIALGLLALKGSRFCWKGPAGITLWLLLLLPSTFNSWGGRIDFYRGVLAQHREEWNLAAEYYENAARDPSAPDIVKQRALYCRQMMLSSDRQGSTSL